MHTRRLAWIAAATSAAHGLTATDETQVTAAKYDTLKYLAYELTFSCADRSAIRWRYTLGDDLNAADRPSNFYLDPNYGRECQQKAVLAYGEGFDRGHLVASAHVRNSAADRRESHYMTNILPQVSSFNQGVWEKTEAIEACYWTLNGGIQSWGGVKYNETDNDVFVDKWGVKTPDYWWKVVLAKDDKGRDKVISWLFPNRNGLGPLDNYLVSVADIERQVRADGLGGVPVPKALKNEVASKSWVIPSGCGRGRVD